MVHGGIITLGGPDQACAVTWNGLVTFQPCGDPFQSRGRLSKRFAAFTFTPPEGVGVLALFYILAQMIERLQEPSLLSRAGEG
jgi:hypothetical protein